MSIRWRKKDYEQLKKQVRNFNNKVKRLEDKGYNPDFLPSKLSYKDLKSSINDRAVFNTEIQLIKDFTKRGSEKYHHTERGWIPKFAVERAETKLKLINQQRKEQRKLYEKVPKTDRGKILDKGNFTDDMLDSLKPRNFNLKNMSINDFLRFEKSLDNYNQSLDEKNNIYRQNYYKALKNTMSPQEYENLKNIIDDISNERLVMQYYTDINMNIDFMYEPSEHSAIYESLVSAWVDVLKEEKKK